MKSPYVILDKPVITERALQLSEESKVPQYVFKVASGANKIEIRRAIESIYNVKVRTVNTVVVKGKLKRQGRTQGKRADVKKAFVTLEEGQKLEVL